MTRALVGACLLVGAAVAHAQPAPRHDVWGFSGGEAPVAAGDDGACEGCHQTIWAEWRASFHAASWTDPLFRAAYVREPLAICRNCHAPAGAAARGDGVSCAVCHVRRDAVLGARARTSPHPVRAASIGDPRFCGGCHQFDVPRPAGGEGLRLDAMQDTWSEWRASAAGARGVTCVACHMPWVGQGPARHRDHRFAAGHDPDTLRRAITADAVGVRDGRGARVTVTLRVADIGHRAPTGDLFRRVVIRAEAPGGPPREVRLERAFVTSEARGAGGAAVRVRTVARDNRLAARELRAVTLTLPAVTSGARARWRVEWWLCPPGQARAAGLSRDAVRFTLGAGEVALRPAAQSVHAHQKGFSSRTVQAPDSTTVGGALKS